MANGQVSVRDQALTGAFSGAAAGSSLGPIGAAGGAIIGAAIGMSQAESQNEATRKAIRKREEALRRASFLRAMERNQAQSLTTSGRNIQAFNANQGQSSSSPTPNALPAGSTPTSAIGNGISSSGNF